MTGLRERERVLELETTRHQCYDPQKWIITAKSLSHNGTGFGYIEETFNISPVEGSMFLKDLLIYPLKYHEGQEMLKGKLIERAQNFASLKGSHYRAYDGIAYALARERKRNIYGEVDKFPLQTVMVRNVNHVPREPILICADQKPHHHGLQNVRGHEISYLGRPEDSDAGTVSR
jgi:hypothetical protein